MESVESIYYVVSWLCHRQCPHCYEERFIEASGAVTPAGIPYRNLCIGCDPFQTEVLEPVLEQLRRDRLAHPRESLVEVVA